MSHNQKLQSQKNKDCKKIQTFSKEPQIRCERENNSGAPETKAENVYHSFIVHLTYEKSILNDAYKSKTSQGIDVTHEFYRRIQPRANKTKITIHRP